MEALEFWKSVKEDGYSYITNKATTTGNAGNLIGCPSYLNEMAEKYNKPWRFEEISQKSSKSRRGSTTIHTLRKVYEPWYVEQKIEELGE